MNRGLPTPTIKVISDLASQLKGGGIDGALAVRSFPLAAALLSLKVTKGLVLDEPDTCPASHTDVQIDALASVPLLISSCRGDACAY
ncbi:alpha/beta hydrolase family protein [Steroidobacter agaridevorans]|uniref:hypothetical protein n=1 Tax=Steroidobacter agaridevorans TaxID=2695856 RepID=UPI001326C647|nr:hypothetical protein [Steroidobacter agaridevorans]GFE85177.1 hypothetical protein GCM10011488_01310 [Steroidobacter agaridevorans]